MSSPDVVELLYQALNSEHGIIVHEPIAIEILRNRLYAARKENEDFRILSILASPTAPETELWIAKRPTNVKEE